MHTECHAAIHRDLNMLDKRADRNLMQFNKEKSKVLHQYVLGATQLESRFPEKALGFPVDTKLNVSQHCALMAKKLHHLWAASLLLESCQ